MGFSNVQRRAARAAAEIEHTLAAKIQPFENAIDLFCSSRRKVALAPQHFEKTDGRIVVFRQRLHLSIDRRHRTSDPALHLDRNPIALSEDCNIFAEHSFKIYGQHSAFHAIF
ncbi:hypothetical protein D9M72_633640 [compost metagenome]